GPDLGPEHGADRGGPGARFRHHARGAGHRRAREPPSDDARVGGGAPRQGGRARSPPAALSGPRGSRQRPPRRPEPGSPPEAPAAQVLTCVYAMGSASFAREKLGLASAVGALDPDRTNVNGGAIAIGHPVGASGARLVLTLLYEMARRAIPLGLATLCIGGGQ